MSETIAITGKSVKLFKGHYTRVFSPPSFHFSDKHPHPPRRRIEGLFRPHLDRLPRPAGDGHPHPVAADAVGVDLKTLRVEFAF
ncbi:MAG: hypothetical protein ACREYE_11585 [Gammaproteobacteria bacterium]